jgi:hypothetical protein
MAEFHSFGREQRPLKVGGLTISARTDFALRIDHTMPGNILLGIERRKGPTNLSGRAGHASQSRHLTIGRDPTKRYSPNDTIDRPPALSPGLTGLSPHVAS